MNTWAMVPKSRAARLRRQTVALAKAASGVLGSDERAELAFSVLAAPATDALGLMRVSLWECIDDRLEFRAAWPTTPVYAGSARESTPAPLPRRRSRVPAGRVLRIDDLRALPIGDFRALLEQADTRALLDVSIEVAGTRWGQMVFESAGDRAWHADEQASATYFADVFGVALERERRRRAESQLSYLEMYDHVSGVANRSLFLANLEQRLRRLKRLRMPLAALLFIDVDRFQSLNEFFGEQGGNSALATIGERLNAATPDDAVIGRLESDCFGVLLPAPARDWHVTLLADVLLESLAQPIEQNGRSWQASASIGIAFGTAEGPHSVEEWLRNADIASKDAKNSGRNRVNVFDPEGHQTLLERLRIEQGLRRALREDGIEVAYQGEFDLDTGAIVGAEALARWRTPDGELIAAGEFIDVAEATGLIEPIGRIVLQRACREATLWPKGPDGKGRVVRVNVSARQFTHTGLMDEIESALINAGLSPGCLCVEITETTVMTQAEQALITLRALKALGVQIAIDDFGTGYSSLAYLRRFPVDALKLDKSLLLDVETDTTVQAILHAVHSLALALELELVVEGVELPSQEAALRSMGIRRVQGFLHARPEPAAQFRTRL